MQAIQVENPGPASRLIFCEEALPVCQDEHLLVRVHATALNRADLMQRQGKYPPPAGESSIPGLEFAGEVVKVGQQVNRFQVGDRVYGLVGSGAYAEYCGVHQNLAEKIPAQWDYITAAALPESLITANSTLFELGRLSSGETLLIHAAGSGISSLAIQMAILTGANVVSSASNPEKINKALQLGVNHMINYKTDDLVELLNENTINLIVDFTGGDNFGKHLRVLAPQGRLIQIAAMQGRIVTCDLALLMKKRLQINGFVLRSQTIAEKSILWQAAHKRWKEAINQNKLKPLIDKVFNFKDLNQAHQYMLDNKNFGKIVIKIP